MSRTREEQAAEVRLLLLRLYRELRSGGYRAERGWARAEVFKIWRAWEAGK